MTGDAYALAREIARGVSDAGGRAYYVGGMVRDRLLGNEALDVDIEVHGLTGETLDALLARLGEPSGTGLPYGIRGLKGYDIDIALPRRERAVGAGHRDFVTSCDPFMGTKEAASRRDFTINAMMEDILTGGIVDHFGGREDLKGRVLRHVNDRQFAEDPLRVLRGAGFAARFALAADRKTAALMEGMDLTALPGERVLGELIRTFSKAPRPSRFFEVLREVRQLRDFFPELLALAGVPQDPGHHPEGDVWNHTMRTLDGAAALKSEAERPEAFLMAALCHDLGKAVTTRESGGRLHAYGHEEAGVPAAERLLARLSAGRKMTEYVKDMVRLHMAPGRYAASGARTKAYMKLFDASCCPSDLLLLSKADREAGRRSGNDPEGEKVLLCSETEADRILSEMLALYYDRIKAPHVTGGDLIAMGYRPGPGFREALLLARKLQLSGIGREESLRQVAGQMGRLLQSS